MEDALKLLTAHLARVKAANKTGPRALTDAKRWSFTALDDQVGPNLEYWMGLTPADSAKFDDFKKQIVTENLIGPAIQRYVSGMLGKDWEWTLTPPEGDPLPPEDERVAALAAWHRDADAWGALKELAFGVMALGRGSLRVYIPAVYGSDENPVTAGSVATYPEALELIHVMFVPATADESRGEGAALRDEYGRERAYYFLYSVPTEDGKSETRLELQTPEEIGLFKVDGDKYLPIGAPVPNPFYDPAIKRRPRFLMCEARRDGGSMVTQTAIDLQNDYNVTLSNRRRNGDLGGHRQYAMIDGQDPEDDAGNAVPFAMGPRSVVSVKSLMADADGNALATPLKASLQVFDPINVSIFNDHASATKTALLNYYDQLWTVQGEGNLSGESRRESRTAFEKRVALEAEPFTRAGGWLIQTVLSMAAWLVGKPNDALGVQGMARLFLDSQPTDLETLRVLMQAEGAGQLDLETLMESMPVNTDATVLLERVKAGRAENPAIAAAQRTAGLPEGPYLRMLQAAGLPVTPEDIQRAEDMADLGLNPPEPTPASTASAASFAVGDRVTVRPGSEHDMNGMSMGGSGTVEEISTPALGIRLDDMPGEIHKWYVAEELMTEGGGV